MESYQGRTARYDVFSRGKWTLSLECTRYLGGGPQGHLMLSPEAMDSQNKPAETSWHAPAEQRFFPHQPTPQVLTQNVQPVLHLSSSFRPARPSGQNVETRQNAKTRPLTINLHRRFIKPFELAMISHFARNFTTRDKSKVLSSELAAPKACSTRTTILRPLHSRTPYLDENFLEINIKQQCHSCPNVFMFHQISFAFLPCHVAHIISTALLPRYFVAKPKTGLSMG